ncbi:MAG TPA: lysine-2,3-aminomutase-like protein [Azospirillaceae bacterium]|nr:lysine-2,3-aminomutase-like protein [Azospirillaceae bacterium]
MQADNARRTSTTPAHLVEAGLVPPEQAAALEEVVQRYALSVTPAMRDLIDPADPADPIARQFLPSPAELNSLPEELADPIGDGARSPIKGIVHRYPDRVLLMPTVACAVYCRFCFRREVVGGPGGLTVDELDAALGYIRDTPAVWEVILTGGDPLVLSPRRLADIVGALSAMSHVQVIRIHSRVPVVAPERVTDDLLTALATDKALWLSVHANHPREFTAEARAALARLAHAGIALIGQSVLLKGVNDTPDTLEALMRAFVATRVRPYYLHHPDLAPGTGHFRPAITEGQELVAHLRGRVSGLAQPTYVLDIPGGHGKSPIGPVYLDGDTVADWRGTRHDLRHDR